MAYIQRLHATIRRSVLLRTARTAKLIVAHAVPKVAAKPTRYERDGQVRFCRANQTAHIKTAKTIKPIRRRTNTIKRNCHGFQSARARTQDCNALANGLCAHHAKKAKPTMIRTCQSRHPGCAKLDRNCHPCRAKVCKLSKNAIHGSTSSSIGPECTGLT